MINRTLATDTKTQQAAPTAVTLTHQPAAPALMAGLGRGVARDTAVLQRATNGRLPRAGNALWQLQRSHGNHHVQRLVVQAKMLLGPVSDPYEQEADQVARRIAQGQPHRVQRRVAGEGGTAVPLEVESAISSARGGGRPLPGGLQQQMGQTFNTDFSGVRVHTDAQADGLNQSLQARAFTTGQHIFFRRGEYSPGSAQGRQILAHELTHVVQQNGLSGQVLQESADSVVQRTVLVAVDNVNSKVVAKFHQASIDYVNAATASKPDPKVISEKKNAFVPLMALMQHIDFAYAKDGGPVIDFSNKGGLNALKDDEHLYIVEHGRVGSIGKKDAQAVVNFLHAELPKTYKGTIDISSCQAGIDEKAKIDSSLVAKVAEGLSKLGRKGITIRGGVGNTFTHRQFGDYYVVDPADYDVAVGKGDESIVQKDLFPYINQLAQTSSGKLPEVHKISESVAKGTKAYYKDLIDKLLKEKLIKTIDPYVTRKT